MGGRSAFAVIVTTAAMLGFAATSAAATVHRDKYRVGVGHSTHHRYADRYAGYGPWGPAYGASAPWGGNWEYRPLRGPLVHYPGYTYAPGRGIVDEACNLPTSACPNEQRDVNY